MHLEGDIGEPEELELLMDLSNILIGAFTKAFAELLDISYNQGHPIVLGRHVLLNELMNSATHQWERALTIEMGYEIENHNISCDLLVLFTEDSIPVLEEKVNRMIGS